MISESEIAALKVLAIIIIIVCSIGIINKTNVKEKNHFSLYKFIIIVVIINLFLTLLNPMWSIVNLISMDSIESSKFWEVRGQIGDVLAGHFTALAFIGLLASLQYQRKSINQMSDTIKLQTKSILKQSEALELQIKEFKQQTKEFTNQTDEFKTGNYLKIIDRNYTKLHELEQSLTYYINQKEFETYRDLISDIKDAQSIQVSIKDLEALLQQLKLIESNIKLTPDIIQNTLYEEFNVYKRIYYTNEIETIIFFMFLNKSILEVYNHTDNVCKDDLYPHQSKKQQIKIIADCIRNDILPYLKTLEMNSNLEKELAKYFYNYINDNIQSFALFLLEYYNFEDFKKNIQIDNSLIWKNI